jgi:hypothetical protein
VAKGIGSQEQASIMGAQELLASKGISIFPQHLLIHYFVFVKYYKYDFSDFPSLWLRECHSHPSHTCKNKQEVD